MGMRRVVQARIIFWAVEITLGYSKIAGRNFSWMSHMLFGGGLEGLIGREGWMGRTRERDSLGLGGGWLAWEGRIHVLGCTHGIFEVVPF